MKLGIFIVVITGFVAVANSAFYSNKREDAVNQPAAVENVEDKDLLVQSFSNPHPMFTENLRLKREPKFGLRSKKKGRLNIKSAMHKLPSKRSAQFLGGNGMLLQHTLTPVEAILQNPFLPGVYPQVPLARGLNFYGRGMNNVGQQFY